MMDFLKPPTDNLYKFLAMSGLLLFLISLTYPPWRYYRFQISIYDLEKDIKILKLETKAEKTRYDDYKAEVEKLGSDIKDTANETENLKRSVQSLPSRAKVPRRLLEKRRLLEARLGEHEKRLVEYQKQYPEKRAAFDASEDALDRQSIELEYKLDLITWTARQLRALSWVSIICCGLGGGMATTGFIFWYRRVQVHQDAILRKRPSRTTRLR